MASPASPRRRRRCYAPWAPSKINLPEVTADSQKPRALLGSQLIAPVALRRFDKGQRVRPLQKFEEKPLALLLKQGSDLRGYDFSRLSVRQAYRRGVLAPHLNLAGAELSSSVFTDAFRPAIALAFHPAGQWLAGGTSKGMIRLWRMADGQPARIYHGPTTHLWSIAFSPDGHLLASGGEDSVVRL